MVHAKVKHLAIWLAVGVLWTGLSGCGVSQILQPEQTQNPGGDQNTVVARRGNLELTASGSGTLTVLSRVEMTFDIQGVLEEILVDAGDEVEEGQLLARLEEEPYREQLVDAERNLRELTSKAAVADAGFALAEAKKAVQNIEAELKLLISPYVYKAEQRLEEAKQEQLDAQKEAEDNPSEQAQQRIADAEDAVNRAELSLSLNQETYEEQYIPEYFNYPWRDRWGRWHDYYAPPSEHEIALIRAELADARAQVEEMEIYVATLKGEPIPEGATGARLKALQEARDAVSDARQNLESIQLLAPISGVVLEVNGQVSEKVAAEPILTLAKLDPPTLEVTFDESDWSLVKKGNAVEVMFDALPEMVYHGWVSRVEPMLISQQGEGADVVGAVVTLDTFDNGWADLPLGSAAAVEVTGDKSEDTVLLPIAGLQEEQGNKGIVYFVEDGDVQKREVKLGLRDSLFVEVISGLKVGDTVVIDKVED